MDRSDIFPVEAAFGAPAVPGPVQLGGHYPDGRSSAGNMDHLPAQHFGFGRDYVAGAVLRMAQSQLETTMAGQEVLGMLAGVIWTISAVLALWMEHDYATRLVAYA